MKKLILGIFVFAFFVLLYGLFQTRVLAATNPGWDVRGNYTLDLTCTSGCSGVYNHTLNVDTENFVNGNFSGTGNYIDDSSYTWTVTGNLNGSNFTFHIVYIGAGTPYAIDGTGTVSNTGTLSGTASSSTSQQFTFSTSSGSAVSLKLDYQSQLNKQACGGSGDPVIDVTENIKNDTDSGFAGNDWALDTIQRHITVWNVTGNTYCAVISDDGSFKGIAEQKSPGQSGTLTGKEHGDFNGGYRTNPFTATLFVTDPVNWPLHGKVKPSPVDYQCTANVTNPSINPCPGAIDWVGQYFHNVDSSFNKFLWWGWIYKGGDYGTWVNAINQTAGDIIDSGVHTGHHHYDRPNHWVKPHFR